MIKTDVDGDAIMFAEFFGMPIVAPTAKTYKGFISQTSKPLQWLYGNEFIKCVLKSVDCNYKIEIPLE